MAMRTRTPDRQELWIVSPDLPDRRANRYERLNALLDAHGFDPVVEDTCQRFYAPVMGRPGLPPGRYVRLLLLGDFEASMRNAASRRARVTPCRFVVFCGCRWMKTRRTTRRSRARRRQVCTWVQQRLVDTGLLKARRAIDATTLEATPTCAASFDATAASAETSI
jgi:transposase